MVKTSQNNKIILTAASIFLVSLSILLFFLDKQGENLDYGHADVLSIEEDAGHAVLDENGGIPLEIYKKYLENNDEPWLVTDSPGRIQHASEEFCELMDKKPGDLEKELLFDFINTKDLPEMVSINNQIIQGGEQIRGFGPYRLLSGDEEILVLFTAYPILGEEGMVEKIIYSLKDITKQVEELNDDGESEEIDNDDDSETDERKDQQWMRDLYPSIDEMDDNDDVKLIVDHITYKED